MKTKQFTIDNPEAIKPVDQEVTVKGRNIELSAAPYSFTLVRIKVL